MGGCKMEAAIPPEKIEGQSAFIRSVSAYDFSHTFEEADGEPIDAWNASEGWRFKKLMLQIMSNY